MLPDSSDTLFVPESPPRDDGESSTWQTGETIPKELPGYEFQSMFQFMQNTMESNFKDIKDKLLELDDRITVVENKYSQLPPFMKSPVPSSSENIPVSSRKRRIPDLQLRFVSYFNFRTEGKESQVKNETNTLYLNRSLNYKIDCTKH